MQQVPALSQNGRAARLASSASQAVCPSEPARTDQAVEPEQASAQRQQERARGHGSAHRGDGSARLWSAPSPSSGVDYWPEPDVVPVGQRLQFSGWAFAAAEQRSEVPGVEWTGASRRAAVRH